MKVKKKVVKIISAFNHFPDKSNPNGFKHIFSIGPQVAAAPNLKLKVSKLNSLGRMKKMALCLVSDQSLVFTKPRTTIVSHKSLKVRISFRQPWLNLEAAFD